MWLPKLAVRAFVLVLAARSTDEALRRAGRRSCSSTPTGRRSETTGQAGRSIAAPVSVGTMLAPEHSAANAAPTSRRGTELLPRPAPCAEPRSRDAALELMQGVADALGAELLRCEDSDARLRLGWLMSESIRTKNALS